MSTQLSRFCQHFDATIRPLLTPLTAAVEALATVGERGPAADLRATLAELRHQLQALVDKVAGQKAYVLIFGPLKSGKSTLMNGLSATYVSEVSSLPAYPCLVFVHHGDERDYLVTDYAGNVASFSDPDALRERIRAAHNELADSIRAAEEAGEIFDPQEHFPQAIRSVDVRLPAPTLRQSGAVLVDTPGLYTRMRFGYDRMTRDFRDAAACAVFVVKSDNLFLEQVFAEFDQLLDLFSRIFLVVNIDATKRDLGADGKLVPSLEQKAPGRVLAAFEELAMSAALRRAKQEGRVRIYAADLLHAASKVLTNDEIPEDFEKLRDDLDEYLASSDYLTAFLGDSLRRSFSLIRHLQRLCTGEEVTALRDRQEELERQQRSRTRELDAIAQALEKDWTPVFGRYSQILEDEVERRARDQGVRTSHAMAAAIDTWFLSGHSMRWLLEKQWITMIRDYRHDVEGTAHREFDRHVSQGEAGMDLDHETSTFLESQGLDLVQLRRRALSDLGDPAWPPQTEVPVDPDEIPIRRGVLDVVAFRSKDAVRDRLFGDREDLDRKIPMKVKAARLGKRAKQYLRECLMEFRDELVQSTVDTIVAHYRDALTRKTVEAIHERLCERRPEARRSLQQLEKEAAVLRSITEPLIALAEQADEMVAKIHALTTQYSRSDPAELLKDEPEPDVVLDPQRSASRPQPGRRRDRSRHR